MQIIYETDPTAVAQVVGKRLQKELAAGRRVTWFVCGGSNIPLIVQAMATVEPSLTSQLTVMLTDERYGMPGHPDSNWKQLDDAGFQAHDATILPTLHAEQTLEDTCSRYSEDVRNALDQTDIVVAHFGMGGDGHIAGILPQSAASRMDEDEDPFVTGYDAGNFIRVTITPKVWQDIDVAYAWVYGDTKYGSLDRLRTDDLSIEAQPAQLLKRLPEAYVYTDQKLPGLDTKADATTDQPTANDKEL